MAKPKLEKPEDRLTAELGAGMVELVIDTLRRRNVSAAEELVMALAHNRDKQRGHEDA